MNLQAKTVMGQMNIVDGQWQGNGAHTLAVREPAGSSGKGDMFVVVQLEGCDEHSRLFRQLSHSLATTIRDTYYHSPTSLGASLRRLGGWLGLLQADPETFLRGGEKSGEGMSALTADRVEALIAERATARKEKRWGEADRIRGLLQEAGIVLEDTPKGTSWRRD